MNPIVYTFKTSYSNGLHLSTGTLKTCPTRFAWRKSASSMTSALGPEQVAVRGQLEEVHQTVDGRES